MKLARSATNSLAAGVSDGSLLFLLHLISKIAPL
jgi:hypothetical protein